MNSLIDQIDRQWHSYQLINVPIDATPEHRHAIRQAFYAGCQTLLNVNDQLISTAVIEHVSTVIINSIRNQ